MAQLGLHCLKKAGSRTRHPLPGLSRWRSGWNVPRSREPAEVIQANHIDVSQQSPQAINAPPITTGMPCVRRVTPVVVGRYGTGHYRAPEPSALFTIPWASLRIAFR